MCSGSKIQGIKRVYKRQVGRQVLRRWLWVALMAVGLTAGCTGFAESSREGNEVDATEDVSAAQVLYLSMVEVFEAETEGVDVAVESHLSVVSHFEELDRLRRRRFIGRVMPVGRGIGVKITGEVQVGTPDQEGQIEWREEAREAVAAEVEPEELRLARRIERRYHERARERRRR